MENSTGGLRKRISAVIVASGCGQAITVLSAPLLTKFYSPAEIGIYGVSMTIAMALAMLATGRYEFALPVAVHAKKASPLIWLALMCASVFLAVLAILLVAGQAFGVLETAPYRQLAIGLGLVAALVIWQVLFQNAIAQRDLKAVSVNHVARASLISLGQIATGFFGWTSLGLLAGQIFGLLAGSSSLLRSLPRSLLKARPTSGEILGAAKHYADFPQFNLPQNLLIAGAMAMAPLFLSIVFSPEMAGFFWLTHRVLALPAAVITDAIRPVLVDHFAELRTREESLLPTILKTAFGLLALFSPVIIVIVVAGPELFGWAFGKDWATTGDMARILVFSAVVGFINVPFSVAALVCRWQAQYLYFEILSFACCACSLLLAARYFDPLGTILAYALAKIVCSLLFFSYVIIKTARTAHG
jgi:O-antigen/teichoic acid export membrane protein